MPKTAHGIDEETFCHWLAHYEPDTPAINAPREWLKFCNWVCR